MFMSSVLRSWVENECTWMMQAVLLAAFRNCDGASSAGPHKTLVRGIRMLCIKSSFPRAKLSSGFVPPNHAEILVAVDEWVNKDWDRFPVHYVTHVMHAAEVIAYCHPDINVRQVWGRVYVTMVDGFHLNVESKEHFFIRLEGDKDFMPEENEQDFIEYMRIIGTGKLIEDTGENIHA